MSEIGSDGQPAGASRAAWLRPATEENDLRRYLTTLRERRLLILACTVITTLVALAYVELSSPVYRAQSDLLITPANVSGNVALAGLPLLQSSSDPTRDVETAAELVATTDVAAGVKAGLGLHGAPRSILDKVTATPVAQSNVVAVTAEGSTPGAAARLANAFATVVIAQRTAAFQTRLAQQIALLSQRAATSPPDVAAPLNNAVSQLKTLSTGPLPDMRIATTAQPPTTAAAPRKGLSIAVGILSGLLIGIVAAFALEAIDPRIRREEALRRLFDLPVLARIPRKGDALGGMTRLAAHIPVIGRAVLRWRDHRSLPRGPMALSPAGLEGYRTLRATLLASRTSQPSSILVTGAGQLEGKTTTAINLAASLSWSGASVILLEADLRRPSIARALGINARLDLSNVLRGQVDLERALVDAPGFGGALRVLLARRVGEGNDFAGDELLLPTASGLLSTAQHLADFVIIDSPPLAEVVDALELARAADEVLLVVRLGQTHSTRLRRLGTLLARTGVEPAGIALIGTEPPRADESYGYVGADAVRRQSAPERLRLTAP